MAFRILESETLETANCRALDLKWTVPGMCKYVVLGMEYGILSFMFHGDGWYQAFYLLLLYCMKVLCFSSRLIMESDIGWPLRGGVYEIWWRVTMRETQIEIYHTHTYITIFRCFERYGRFCFEFSTLEVRIIFKVSWKFLVLRNQELHGCVQAGCVVVIWNGRQNYVACRLAVYYCA